MQGGVAKDLKDVKALQLLKPRAASQNNSGETAGRVNEPIICVFAVLVLLVPHSPSPRSSYNAVFTASILRLCLASPGRPLKIITTASWAAGSA